MYASSGIGCQGTQSIRRTIGNPPFLPIHASAFSLTLKVSLHQGSVGHLIGSFKELLQSVVTLFRALERNTIPTVESMASDLQVWFPLIVVQIISGS